MGGDSIKSTEIVVEVQENGIIRRADTGYLIGRLVPDYSYEQLISVGNMQHTTKYPNGHKAYDEARAGSLAPRLLPVATPAEIAHRIYIEAQLIQDILQKSQSHDGAVDRVAMMLPHIDRLLWSIRHGSTALTGILARLDGGK